MEEKKRKTLRIIATVMLIISVLPWVLPLISSIRNTFFTERIYSGIFGQMTGFDAFFGAWATCLVFGWYIYLPAVILTVISIVLLVKTKKTRPEVQNAESDNDLRKDMQR